MGVVCVSGVWPKVITDAESELGSDDTDDTGLALTVSAVAGDENIEVDRGRACPDIVSEELRSAEDGADENRAEEEVEDEEVVEGEGRGKVEELVIAIGDDVVSKRDADSAGDEDVCSDGVDIGVGIEDADVGSTGDVAVGCSSDVMEDVINSDVDSSD